jgi:hypothetical protein
MTAAGALVSQRRAMGMAMRGMVTPPLSLRLRMAWRRRGMQAAARSSA